MTTETERTNTREEILAEDRRTLAAIIAYDTETATHNHEAEVPAVADGDVDELTDQSRGRWMIHTRDSRHLLDLDQRTWTRLPGPTATWQNVGGTALPLRALLNCRIGEPGLWTTPSTDLHYEIQWCHTTPIRRITPHVDTETPVAAPTGTVVVTDVRH